VIDRMIVWGELRSDNLTSGSGFPTARYDMYKILEGDLTSSNAFCSWGSFYTVINYCNTLLYYAPKVVDRDPNFTPADLQRVRSEALTIRALCYFYLVRTFKDVPWIEEASVTDTQDYNLPKVPEDTIVSRIILDLKEAQKYARTDYGIKKYNKGRITLNAVNALLADVYLWSNQYNECAATCDLVLSDPALKLIEADYMYSQVYYLGNSSESIFELQFSENDMRNTSVIQLYGNATNVLGETSFPANLAYDQYNNSKGAYSPFKYEVSTTVTESATDIRAKDSYIPYGGKFFIFKYAGIERMEDTKGASGYAYRSNTSNWIIYRLSDVMLMKAEALVQIAGQSNMKSALSLVNKTYLRSNVNQDSLFINNYTTKTAMEELVLRERQRELLFEGKRWFDLVRLARREGNTSTLNDYVDHKLTGNAASLGAPVLNAMYMPISKSELDANPKLKQNPYYEETSTSSR
jgi:starch-binding outer membrane protein, SusD/RagB family